MEKSIDKGKLKACKCYFAILKLLLEAKKPLQINEITTRLADMDNHSGEFQLDKKTVGTSVRAVAKALKDAGFSEEDSPIALSIEPIGLDEFAEVVKIRGGFSIGQRPIDYEDVANIVNALGVYEGISESTANEIVSKLKKMVDPNFQGKIRNKIDKLTPEEEEKGGRIKRNLSVLDQADYEGNKVEITNGKWTLNDKGDISLEPGHKYILESWERVINNGNQYLVGIIKEGYHFSERVFRLDRICEAKMLKKPKDEERPDLNRDRINMIKKFGMYGGDPYPITIAFEPRLLTAVVDKFINEKKTIKRKGDLLTINTRAPFTDQFFGWLAGLDGKAFLTDIGKKEYEDFCMRKLNNQKCE